MPTDPTRVSAAPSELNLATAQDALAAAMAYAAQEGLRVSVVVVDHQGVDVAVSRGDGASWFTPEVARAKARTAAQFRRSSAAVGTMKAEHPELYDVVATTLAWRTTTLPGGIPLVMDDEVVGAVGVSGALPVEDVRAAERAAATVATRLAGSQQFPSSR